MMYKPTLIDEMPAYDPSTVRACFNPASLPPLDMTDPDVLALFAYIERTGCRDPKPRKKKGAKS